MYGAPIASAITAWRRTCTSGDLVQSAAATNAITTMTFVKSRPCDPKIVASIPRQPGLTYPTI